MVNGYRPEYTALAERQGKVDNIKTVSMDMSKSFISGAMSQFPKASIIFDKFHIRKALNEALDAVQIGRASCRERV